MSRRSRRRKRQAKPPKPPRPPRFLSQAWFDRALFLMERDSGFNWGPGGFEEIKCKK